MLDPPLVAEDRDVVRGGELERVALQQRVEPRPVDAHLCVDVGFMLVTCSHMNTCYKYCCYYCGYYGHMLQIMMLHIMMHLLWLLLRLLRILRLLRRLRPMRTSCDDPCWQKSGTHPRKAMEHG